MELNRFSTKANISGKNFKVTPIKEESVTKTLFHQINQVFSLSPLSKHRQAPLEKKKLVSLIYLTALTGKSLVERMKHLFVSHNMLNFAYREDIIKP